MCVRVRVRAQVRANLHNNHRQKEEEEDESDAIVSKVLKKQDDEPEGAYREHASCVCLASGKHSQLQSLYVPLMMASSMSCRFLSSSSPSTCCALCG